MDYVALLRGVNVGGKSMMDMKTLPGVFESAGMASVRTYINSGNVIFSSELSDRDEIASLIERAIVQAFHFPVRVLVLGIEKVRAVVAALPADWANDAAAKCDVFFLWGEVDDPGILERLDWDPAMEDVRYTPGAVIRRIDRANAAKSRLTRIVGTPLYQQMTVRNCNTARKILKLLETRAAQAGD